MSARKRKFVAAGAWLESHGYKAQCSDDGWIQVLWPDGYSVTTCFGADSLIACVEQFKRGDFITHRSWVARDGSLMDGPHDLN
jgi:hypothetical protein